MIIEIILLIAGVYFLLGICFAVPFVLKGAKAIDPAAEEGSKGFRIMIFPGVALFWPLLLKRWLKKEQPPEEKSAHRRIQA